MALWIVLTLVGTIDTLGAVARVEWDAVPESASKEVAFRTGFSVKDAGGNPVATLAGGVKLRASFFETNPELTVLHGTAHNYENNSGRFNLGWSFTPQRDLRVTDLRSYFGVRIQLLDAAGKTLAEQELPEGGGSWRETRLREAVLVKAGHRYQIQADTGGQNYFAFRAFDRPAFPNEDLDIHYVDNFDLWLVDFKYTAVQSASVVTPMVVENLADGSWAGDLSVSATGGYVFLEAEAEGVVGFSKAFQVVPPNNLRLTQLVSSTACTVGDVVIYTLRATNSGPDARANVLVTNVVPAGVNILQVSASKGVHTTEGTNVVFNLGELGGSEAVELQVAMLAGAPGVYQQRAEIIGDGTESMQSDDQVASQVQVFENPEIVANDVVVFSRANRGVTTNAIFEVSLTAPASRNVYVNYQTEPGTAMEGQDYQRQSGTLLFAPGVVKQRVMVPVADGLEGEGNETFNLQFSEPVNAVLSREAAVCRIINPAVRPTVTLADVRVAEGDAEFGVEAVFKFKLSHPMDVPVVGGIQAVAGTAKAMTWPADPGEADFYEVWGGFGFEAGQTESVIAVPINGDDFREPNETFRLLYWTDMANTPRTFATATIVNDDPTPAITVGDALVREDSVRNSKLVFPVELSKAVSTAVVFNYRPAGVTATAGVDFEEEEGIATIAAGDRNTTIEVTVLPDRITEALEEVRLDLSLPVGAVFVANTATGRIADASNKLPEDQFISPAYGSMSSVGATVNVQVEGKDPDGDVVKMTLAINGVVQKEANSGALSFDWVPESPGNYTLVARAWDNQGTSATSSEWKVQVVSSSVVQILSPANDSSLPANEPVVVRVDYSGATPLQRIELSVDGALAGTFAEGAFSFSWDNAPEGRHRLIVTATDVDGGTHSSDPINLTITPERPTNDRFAASATLVGYFPRAAGTTRGATVEANEPIHGNPSARASVWWNWTAPANGKTTLTATNEIGDPLYAVVYLGDLETALVAKAQFVGNGSFEAAAGQRYSIAVDGVGTYSGPVTLQLALAEVNLVSPTAQAAYRAPASILLKAEINAPADGIEKVEFFEGATWIGSASGVPYEFNWLVETNSYHKIRAVVTDYLGGTRASADVSFVVRPSNDDFQNAIEITGYSSDVSTSNIGASRRGDPTYADNQGGHSIWYRWTVPEDGLCTIFGEGKDFQLLLGAYLGETLGNLAHVAVNAMGGWDVPLTFQVAKGTTLNILVDGMFMEEGAIDWWLRLRPANDDIAGARRIREPFYETISSHRGASTESREATLHPSGSVSVWWLWEAPATASTKVLTASVGAPTQIRIYQNSGGNLTPVVSSSGWSLTNSVSFNAATGQSYLIAVLGENGNTNDFGLQINQDLLRLSYPLDGAAYPANSTLKIAAVAPESLGEVARIEFLINDSTVATAATVPYEVEWPGGAPATYRIQAKGVRSNGETVLSLPVMIVLYENNQLPKPSLVMNSRGLEGLVANSVGQLFVFGPQDEFVSPGVHEESAARPGQWPEAVRQWAMVMGGIGDVLENTPWDIWPGPAGYHVWSLTDDGVLYQDGHSRIAFPPGVTHWTGFYGTGNCLAVGDDGAIYLNGEEKMDLGLSSVLWKDIAIGYIYMARLSKDGDVYMSGRGIRGEAVHRQLTPPSGVKFTEMKSSMYALLLRGTDGKLYQSGDPKPAETLAGADLKLVPTPTGVTNFISFALGGFHALAIGDDGELYTWGRNWEGQLGVGAQDEGRMALQKVPKPPGKKLKQ
ncbi:MAG TPA: hypothetical protein DCE44_10000, partial [Verrucomicrobiales bacterium]|nr:hypothetical protein [Verrucomicrobiales bacterium]